MDLFRAIFDRIAMELRLHRLGRRSLREGRFRKYKIFQSEDRVIRERLLRRLPRGLETTVLFC